MAVAVTIDSQGAVRVVRLAGRLDAHGAAECAPALAALDARGNVVLDLGGVDYLSSAGVRIVVMLHRKLSAQGRRLVLVGLQPYCREVLRVSGLDGTIPILPGLPEALAEVGAESRPTQSASGRYTFRPGSSERGAIEVLGSIEDVLAARVAEDRVWSKKFSAKEYSIGLGGLGPNVSQVLPLMGEMMTIGGTMVWLPTDGNDTPDFLVPRQESDEVVIRTGFNASLAGKFNEYVEFEATAPEGATLTEIYRDLFDMARARRPDYRGALGLAMRAEVGRVFGCGVTRSPIAAHAPSNGKLITDPENYGGWFESDVVPRHRDVTGLICSIGLDTTADLSVFDQTHLGKTFYRNPGNQADSRERLHTHGVFFQPFPLGERPWTLEREIQSVVEEGTFLDMRHLFDRTTIVWALMGVLYVQEFRADPAA